MKVNVCMIKYKHENYIREAIEGVLMQNIDFDMLLTRENIVETIEKVIPKAFDIMSSSLHYITGLVVIFIMILYMFFILVDFKSLSTDWEVLIPKRYRKFSRQLFSDLASGMNIYFRKCQRLAP